MSSHFLSSVSKFGLHHCRSFLILLSYTALDLRYLARNLREEATQTPAFIVCGNSSLLLGTWGKQQHSKQLIPCLETVIASSELTGCGNSANSSFSVRKTSLSCCEHERGSTSTKSSYLVNKKLSFAVNMGEVSPQQTALTLSLYSSLFQRTWWR